MKTQQVVEYEKHVEADKDVITWIETTYDKADSLKTVGGYLSIYSNVSLPSLKTVNNKPYKK